MISLKLVIPLGCLVALSSALPWSNKNEQPQNSVDNRDRYRHPPLHCDSLSREARYSHPGLFQRCVCHTARGEGRENAYTYYGDKYGVPKDVIASILERCRQSYQSHRPVHNAASSFDESRSSFQDFTLDNTISLKKASALTTFASFPADDVQKLGDWSYSKAGSPPYNGIYPNFLTGSSAPDLSTVPSQETSSSQDSAPTNLEENSNPSSVTSLSEADDPQDSTEGDSEDYLPEDMLRSDDLVDAFDEPDDSAQTEEDVDRQVTEATSAANVNDHSDDPNNNQEPAEDVDQQLTKAASATDVSDESEGGPNDNREPAEAGDGETSGDDFTGQVMASGGDPSNNSREDSDEQLTENQKVSRGLLYDLDGGENSWEGPVAILSRGILYAFDGVKDINESPVPMISRGIEAVAEYVGEPVETIEESGLTERRADRGEPGIGKVIGEGGSDPEHVSMISRDLGDAPGSAIGEDKPKVRDTEWPSFRTNPGQGGQINPNSDEGEE